MEWTADVGAGDWIRERLDDPWRGTVHDVVPRGFPFYTRVFHGATRSRPVGDSWPPLPQGENRRAWEDFVRRRVEVETRPARWADAAAAFGTELHGTAQWGAIVRARGTDWNPDAWQITHSPDGWQFDAPFEGQLEAAALSTVAEIAANHTRTPDDLFIALWDGWGGIVGGMAHGPARVVMTLSSEEDRTDSAMDVGGGTDLEFRAQSTGYERAPVGPPTWHPGILSDEISQGPRLSLLNRDYVLFRGGAADLSAGWELTAPWRDRWPEELGFPARAESPSIVWPADREWIVVSEVDWDSTIVAGSSALQRALCTDPRIEALGLREGASLQWDADVVNR